jgi:hypothetical protein
MLASLVVLRRTDVMQRFASANFETGELNTEVDRAMHNWVLQQLHLQPQQVSSIARAMDCFSRLLNPIMQERQQLQSKISQQQEQPGGSGCNSSGCGSISVDSYKHHMAKREASLLRLSGLMRKEYLVRTAAAAAIVGVLTYVQLATAAVLMTPHAVSLQMLGMLVQEQQQQHKHQKQQPKQQHKHQQQQPKQR